MNYSHLSLASWLLLFLALGHQPAHSFQATFFHRKATMLAHYCRARRYCTRLFEKDEETVYERTSSSDLSPLSTTSNEDLLPPQVNLKRDSILFGDNPETMKRNTVLTFWKFCKRNLPYLMTGARSPRTADDNPLGGIYNMLFVRIPVLLSGLVYAKNCLQGHPLIIDFGEGPMVVSPLIVAFGLYVLLR